VTVFLLDGQKVLKDSLHAILEMFLTDADYARGIFIKPNIVFAVRASSGEITPPVLVETLVTTLRERCSSVDILLGEGVAAGCNPEENFRVSGYAQLAQECNIPLINLDVAKRRAVAWKFGSLKLPVVAFERTYINLPILKPSSACVISGAMKNQKGLLLPAVKKQFHSQGKLHEYIAELNRVARPRLTILDGSLFFGRDTLLSGDNCGEIDATACRLLGIDEPEHVQLAREARVYATGFEVKGDALQLQNPSTRPEMKEYKSLGRLRLWSNPMACTGCRYIFRDLKRSILQPRNIKAKAKLVAYSLKGAELVMGTNPHWRKEHPVVICVGACTRKIAKEGGYIHIPGCPPTLQDFLDHLP
jgi:uncharacterized protein (DUF362 family)